MTSQAEDQLKMLRERYRELESARKWLQEYRLTCTESARKALNPYQNWLFQQQNATREAGERIKKELEMLEKL